MAENFDGEKIARQRIAEEAERRTGFLDLSQLGLSALPTELFALNHLKRMHLGLRLAHENGGWVQVQCEEPSNDFGDELYRLSELHDLEALSLSWPTCANLRPLTSLGFLKWLDCSRTQVSDLGPLAKLTALQSLDCRDTQVSDLGPLAKLTALQSLDCRDTQVSDLRPLAKLTALQSLDCSRTQVSDLGPLAKLTALQSLDCSGCILSDVSEAFWHKLSLIELVLHNSRVLGLPMEVLSQSPGENCLDALRAHLKDVAAGAELVTDVKLLVLGNGRSGKTQLCRRLCDLPFQPSWNSTHGIRVTSATLPKTDGQTTVRLQIWDFGGQDIYHGTHSLFVHTRAAFVLTWAKDAEAAREYEHEGISFRNHPLLYWVEYVRQLAEAKSPVVIVQTKCDHVSEEEPRAPVPDDALKALGFRRELHFGAGNDRGRDELTLALRNAVAWLRDKQGVARIGAGRLRVQRRLEALRNADGALPPEYRLLDKVTFRAWCEEEGGVSSPDHLLAYLHNAGIVFYRTGLFHDQIVLDHAWALNAIYAVFDRTRCYRRLLKEGGRFDRVRLEELIWREQGFSTAEQHLFLSMMRSCGICFIYRSGPRGIEDDETIFIAPDLLPGRDAVQTELDDRWGLDPPDWSVTFEYSLLHPGWMRDVIAYIGYHAGLDAIYWRGGVYVYETTTRSRALIEQEVPPDAWHGTVRLHTKGSQGRDLLDRLTAWIKHENDRMGLRPELKSGAPPASRLSALQSAEPPLVFGPEPATQPVHCVSYAWNDNTPGSSDREAIVNKLCAEAEGRGIKILRDKTDMRLGDRISAFMPRLAQGDRVFVILSEKYLRSIYCMTELYEIWLNCKGKDHIFRSRIRVFALPDAKISTLFERVEHAAWWKQQHARVKALVDKHGEDFLSDADYAQFRRMGHFVRHAPDILSLIQDTLRPRSFEELVRYGFDDPPPSS
jgi:internalin A